MVKLDGATELPRGRSISAGKQTPQDLGSSMPLQQAEGPKDGHEGAADPVAFSPAVVFNAGKEEA